MNKQAEQIVEFLSLIDKVAGRMAVTTAGKPLVMSLRSKPPAPPLPPKEESLLTAVRTDRTA